MFRTRKMMWIALAFMVLSVVSITQSVNADALMSDCVSEEDCRDVGEVSVGNSVANVEEVINVGDETDIPLRFENGTVPLEMIVIEIEFNGSVLQATSCQINILGSCDVHYKDNIVRFELESTEERMIESPYTLGRITFEALEADGSSPINVNVVEARTFDDSESVILSEQGGMVTVKHATPLSVTLTNNSTNSIGHLAWLVPLYVIGSGISLFAWSKR